MKRGEAEAFCLRGGASQCKYRGLNQQQQLMSQSYTCKERPIALQYPPVKRWRPPWSRSVHSAHEWSPLLTCVVLSCLKHLGIQPRLTSRQHRAMATSSSPHPLAGSLFYHANGRCTARWVMPWLAGSDQCLHTTQANESNRARHSNYFALNGAGKAWPMLRSRADRV